MIYVYIYRKCVLNRIRVRDHFKTANQTSHTVLFINSQQNLLLKCLQKVNMDYSIDKKNHMLINIRVIYTLSSFKQFFIATALRQNK